MPHFHPQHFFMALAVGPLPCVCPEMWIALSYSCVSSLTLRMSENHQVRRNPFSTGVCMWIFVLVWRWPGDPVCNAGVTVGLVQTENHQMPQGLDQSFCTKHCFCFYTCLSSSPLCVHLPQSVTSCLLVSVQQIIADFYMKCSSVGKRARNLAEMFSRICCLTKQHWPREIPTWWPFCQEPISMF